MQEFSINPRFLERSIEPTLMGPDMARFLENVDITFLEGRVRRGTGYVKTDVAAPSSNVYHIMSMFIAERWDGTPVLLDHNTAGKVRTHILTTGRSFISSNDYNFFTTGTRFEENFNEDTTTVAEFES
jgi:hypothetical protein